MKLCSKQLLMHIVFDLCVEQSLKVHECNCWTTVPPIDFIGMIPDTLIPQQDKTFGLHLVIHKVFNRLHKSPYTDIINSFWVLPSMKTSFIQLNFLLLVKKKVNALSDSFFRRSLWKVHHARGMDSGRKTLWKGDCSVEIQMCLPYLFIICNNWRTSVLKNRGISLGLEKRNKFLFTSSSKILVHLSLE